MRIQHSGQRQLSLSEYKITAPFLAGILQVHISAGSGELNERTTQEQS